MEWLELGCVFVAIVIIGALIVISRRAGVNVASVPLITGECLLFFLVYTMVIPALGFFIGLTIGPLTMLISLICTVLTCLILNRKSMLTVSIAFALSLVLIMSSCLICMQIYDMTWDPIMYHKLAVYALGNGWDPLRGSVEVWQRSNEAFEPTGSIWIDHYPKGIYYIAAALYTAFGNIEAGKAYTLILMIASAFILYTTLAKKLPRIRSFIVTTLTVCNPITCVQMLSFYNDAFLMLSILVLLIGLTGTVVKNGAPPPRLCIALIGCGFILCSGTKFTGFAYAGAFSLSFHMFHFARTVLKKQDAAILARLSMLFATTILISFAIVGSTSYLMNIIDHGNPFYPLAGSNTVDIVTNNEPPGYSEMNNIDKLFHSYFGVVSNDHSIDNLNNAPRSRPPFLFTATELDEFSVPDVRIGGFGVLYSGILVIQLVILALTIPLMYRTQKRLLMSFTCFAVPALALLFGVSESWWARYSMYQYLFNAYALIFILLCTKELDGVKRLISRIAAVVFSILLFINTGLVAYTNIRNTIEVDSVTKMHIDNMKQANSEGRNIQVKLLEGVPGMIYILADNGIDFELVDDDPSSDDKDFDWNVRYLKYRIA